MSDAPLDAAAQALARRLLRDLPADRPRTRADVDLLPAPVARLLHARLDARAAEATALPASPWVDADGDGVREATQTWRQAVRDAVRVPADVWAPAVEEAARLAVAHLIRPAETLAAYAFEGETGPVPASLALRRTRAFGPYGYLPEIAGRYVERKEIDHLDRASLERLMRRIDRRMVSAFGPGEWAELLAPLVDLVGPDGTPEGAVSADLLRALFREKDVHPNRDLLDADTASEERLRTWLADAFAPPASETEAAPADEDDAPAEAVASHAVLSAEDVAPPAHSPPPVPPEAELSDAEPSDATHPEDTGVPDGEEVPATHDTTVSETSAPASGRAPEAPTPEAADDPTPAPPTIGSRYNDPADEPVHDSDVLGPARTVEPSPLGVPVIFPHVPEEPAASERPPEAEDLPVTSEPTSETPPPEPDTEAASPPQPDAEAERDEEPLWMRLARERGAEAPAAPSPEPEETPLWMRFAPPSDAPEAAAEDDLPAAAPLSLDALETRVLGFAEDDERRAWFVADLFRASPSEYQQTLVALDACRSYTEATQVIEREVFRKHRINPYTDAAVAFVDALQAQFTAQGRG